MLKATRQSCCARVQCDERGAPPLSPSAGLNRPPPPHPRGDTSASGQHGEAEEGGRRPQQRPWFGRDRRHQPEGPRQFGFRLKDAASFSTVICLCLDNMLGSDVLWRALHFLECDDQKCALPLLILSNNPISVNRHSLWSVYSRRPPFFYLSEVSPCKDSSLEFNSRIQGPDPRIAVYPP